jgi:hypothetical protein
LKLVHPEIARVLTSGFREVAPEHAVAKYVTHVSSLGFLKQLLKEVKLMGGYQQLESSGHLCSDDVLVEHLVLLAHRKEIDLKGMVKHAAVPTGFKCGVGSPTGNNCYISSVCQCLQGAPQEGPLHEELCRKIRAAGLGPLWKEANYIEASPETLQFIANHILGPSCSVTCWLYSGFDGGNEANIACGPVGNSQHHVIHLFNPVGVHFDPLWKA